MTPIKLIVAHNLAILRKKEGLTQSELAAKFNYSDKAVSKWEHAETMPDLDTLDRLCQFYGVSLADLVTEGGIEDSDESRRKTRLSNGTKIAIAALSSMVVWLLAVLVFYVLNLINAENASNYHNWMVFLWAVPATSVVLLIFNGIWGRALWRTILIFILIWSGCACVYLQLGQLMPGGRGWELWAVFLIGIPPSVASVLWFILSTRAERRNQKQIGER